MKRLIPALLLRGSLVCALGCAHTDVSDETPSREPAPTEAADEPSPDESADEAATGPTVAEMRARAEAFVRAQGYADGPPTVSADEIVHEGLEGTVEMRRNTLNPVPASGGPDGNGGWSFTFRYMDSQYEGRGRLLIMRAAETPRFVHQDIVFPQ